MKARIYLDTSVFGALCDPDARHIAVASVNGVHTVVSWNFRHMVNLTRRRLINSVNLRENFGFLDIVSPWEIMDEEA